jgi:hypothetical protein
LKELPRDIRNIKVTPAFAILLLLLVVVVGGGGGASSAFCFPGGGRRAAGGGGADRRRKKKKKEEEEEVGGAFWLPATGIMSASSARAAPQVWNATRVLEQIHTVFEVAGIQSW